MGKLAGDASMDVPCMYVCMGKLAGDAFMDVPCMYVCMYVCANINVITKSRVYIHINLYIHTDAHMAASRIAQA